MVLEVAIPRAHAAASRLRYQPLRKPGRGGLSFIQLVQRGKTVIMVSTPQEAEELVAFLNYCGMDEFTGR